MTHSRHVLPSFVERTSHGVTETNPYNKLFEGRIVFLGTPIDHACANDILAQRICLEATEPDRPIEMYINSPGGSIRAMAAIYDTMQYIRPESNLQIQAAEVTRMRAFLEFTLATHTGRSIEQVHSDIDRDLFLTAEQAVEYGMADRIVPSRERHSRGAP